MDNPKKQADLQDRTTTDSDALNRSGSQSSSGGDEDVMGPDGDSTREKTSRGEILGNKIDTDNEGRVTQRSNTDV